MAEGHPPHLAHHFDTPGQQFAAGKLGMWIFLVTEILLFGGLFCAYAVYRAAHPEVFLYAHRYLDVTLGAVNTVVLLLSSFTVAWAVRAAQLGQRRLLVGLLLATVGLAAGFLGIKAVEYHHKWKEGLLWGTRFSAAAAVAAPSAEPPAATALPAVSDSERRSVIAPAPDGPPGLAAPVSFPPAGDDPAAAPRNVQQFFAIYFVMTGLHGVHVIAGMVLLLLVARRAMQGEFGPEYFTPVDLSALYWHLVDLIWIYLFPLLYLIH